MDGTQTPPPPPPPLRLCVCNTTQLHLIFFSVIIILLSFIFTLVVVLSTLVVESVRDLVSNDPANTSVVHVGWSVRLEKITLKTKKNGVSSKH